MEAEKTWAPVWRLPNLQERTTTRKNSIQTGNNHMSMSERVENQEAWDENLTSLWRIGAPEGVANSRTWALQGSDCGI